MSSSISVSSAPPRRLSAVLALLCSALIIVYVGLSIAIPALMPAVMTEGLGLPAPADGFTTGERIIIVITSLVPTAFAVYALVCARRCFRSFVQDEYFTPAVVRSLRGVAAGIALWVLAGWLTTPLSNLLLTLGEEQVRVSVRFSTSGALTLLFAGIIWQIAHIMTRAAALAEENAQFV